MQKAGGIVAIIAGILGVVASGATFLLGIATTNPRDGFPVIFASALAGLAFSFAIIVLGALGMNTPRKRIGILLILASIGGAILGWLFVALPMALALVGGVLVTIGARKTTT